MSSSVWPGTIAPMTNCATNSDSSSAASPSDSSRLSSTATANALCAAVSSSSLDWTGSPGSPAGLRDEIANTSGSVPTSSVHWLTLEETRVVTPLVTNSRQAYNPATSSSGASDASGASHWTNRNELIPNSSPLWTSPSAKCSADSMITIALNRKHATTHRRRVRVGNVPIQAAGPTRWGTSGGALEMRQVYATKIPSSTHRSNRVTVRLNGRVREYSVAS